MSPERRRALIGLQTVSPSGKVEGALLRQSGAKFGRCGPILAMTPPTEDVMSRDAPRLIVGFSAQVRLSPKENSKWDPPAGTGIESASAEDSSKRDGV